MAAYTEEFTKRGVKLLGLSCDDVQSHNEWIKDIEAYTVRFSFLYIVVIVMFISRKSLWFCLNLFFVPAQPGCKVTYPILADPKREFIKMLNMVDPDEKDSEGNQLPSRALHIVGPDKKVLHD